MTVKQVKQLIKKYQGTNLSKGCDLRRLDDYIEANDLVHTFRDVLHGGFGKTFGDLEHELFLTVVGDTDDDLFAYEVKEATAHLVRVAEQPHLDYN
jgi:hypothetical protein